jgi:drug/metabolite transporter (DMT)-like permease
MGMRDDDSKPAKEAPAEATAADGRRLAGIGLMCGAIICFACLDACAKWLNRSIDPLETVWVRYVASVLFVSAILNPFTRPRLLRTQRPLLQGARSLLLLGSTALNFVALMFLQMTETISINFTTPLIVALIGGPLLGEWVGPRRLAAIAIGFVGVLVMTRPGLGGMHPAALLSLIGAVCYALYNISTRVLASYDSSETTMFYSGVAGLVLFTPLMPFVWKTPPLALTWAVIAGLGAAGALGHWLLILAHQRAPAAILAPFIYTQIVWSVILGYVVFGDLPDRMTLVGAAVVIASGLYLLQRERAKGGAAPA